MFKKFCLFLKFLFCEIERVLILYFLHLLSKALARSDEAPIITISLSTNFLFQAFLTFQIDKRYMGQSF